MRRHAPMRGQQAGLSSAEAFIQHRGHAYPRNDLLAELFGAAGPTELIFTQPFKELMR